MTTQITKLASTEDDDGSRVPTPIASSHNARFSDTSTISGHVDSQGSSSVSSDSDAFSLSLSSMFDAAPLALEPAQPDPSEASSSQFLLPLPTASSSRSQSFSGPSDVNPDIHFTNLPDLPPDLALADVTVARA